MNPIYDSHDECIRWFERLLDLLHGSEHAFNEYITYDGIKTLYSRYNVFAGNIGAHQLPQQRTSLDYRLRDATFHRRKVIVLLQGLANSLQKAADLVSGNRKPVEECSSPSESGSDPSDDGMKVDESSSRAYSQYLSYLFHSPAKSPKHSGGHAPDSAPPRAGTHASAVVGLSPEIIQVKSAIEDWIRQLYRVGTSLRRPVPIDRLSRASLIDVSHYEEFDKAYIKDACPTAAPDLQLRLARAITRRRQILEYRRLHQQSISAPRTPWPRPTERIHDGPDSDPVHPTAHEDRKSQFGAADTINFSVARSTEATSFRHENPEDDANEELDETSETGSLFSDWSTSSTAEKTSFPEWPTTREENPDDYFQCPLCFYLIKISNRREWRSHILADLYPYICTFGNCSHQDELFQSQSDWYHHEISTHRIEWYCNQLGHEAFQNEARFIEHLLEEHGDVFSEKAAGEWLRLFQRAITARLSPCPLCPSVHVAKKSGTTVQLNQPGMIATSKLKRHLGRHLKRLALFAIPRSAYHLADSTNASGSSASVEGGVRIRSPVLQPVAEDHEDINMDDDDVLEHEDEDEDENEDDESDREGGNEEERQGSRQEGGASESIGNIGRTVSTGEPHSTSDDVSEFITDNFSFDSASRTNSPVPPGMISGTPGLTETLDPRYIVQSNPRQFFRRGKMFSLLYTEPAHSTSRDFEGVTVVRFGEFAYTSIRRFIVVKPRRGWCYACPVYTYGRRGTAKPGVNPSEHAVVHLSTTTPPALLPGEYGLKEWPIVIVPRNERTMLHPASRCNFGMVYAIQYNVKVKDLGDAAPGYEDLIRRYWLEEYDDE